MDAREAKRLSEKNGHKKEFEKRIRQVEREIKDACEYGHTSTCWGMLDQYKNPIDFEVKEHFRKLGYKFRPTGYSGGVWQHTEDIYW